MVQFRLSYMASISLIVSLAAYDPEGRIVKLGTRKALRANIDVRKIEDHQ